MRLKICTTDRIGISPEILAIFAQQQWNIKAVEITSTLIYVHLDENNLSLQQVDKLLASISGYISSEIIDLLPAAKRANHLQTLLSRLHDPIIDIDTYGRILVINQAAADLLEKPINKLLDTKLEDVLAEPILKLIATKPTSSEVSLGGQSFLVDITPVTVENSVTGAVLVFKSMQALGRQVSMLQQVPTQSFSQIMGDSALIKALKAQTKKIASLELPVLISGETGTGKELFARALHSASSRAQGPFLAINCAALPENLLESELFGYASGAFTGAQRGGKPGLFELAHGGTVFLDEVAEMSVYLQAKLLRFLQDFSYRRVGGTREYKADVRIISASHQNLMKLVENKQFREDLFYRINVLTLHLPALRERTEDIKVLSQFFIQQAALQTNKHDVVLSTKAFNALVNYPWPGNIRQLQNILFSAVALSVNNQISVAEIKSLLQQQTKQTTNSSCVFFDKAEQFDNWKSAQTHFETALLKELYPLYSTTRKLAERLGVSHNKIALKLKKYNIRNKTN
jgi:TyrR family helix-turn-helix protein